MAKSMTYEQFARERGLVTDYDVLGHLHGGLMAAHMPKSYHRHYQRKLRELQDARDEGKRAYEAAVSAGEITRPEKPSRIERLRLAASGHPDLESTQAAKRLLARMAAA